MLFCRNPSTEEYEAGWTIIEGPSNVVNSTAIRPTEKSKMSRGSEFPLQMDCRRQRRIDVRTYARASNGGVSRIKIESYGEHGHFGDQANRIQRTNQRGQKISGRVNPGDVSKVLVPIGLSGRSPLGLLDGRWLR